ncbi:MAG: EMC3/TMCO1 family protein [Candidatus Diapherotrites archaeon]
MFVNPQIDIVAISALLAIVSQFIQLKFGRRDEMLAAQKEMKARQKRMQELVKRNDGSAKAELERLEKEMMEGMSKMMGGSMKVMVISMVIFLPAFMLIGAAYSSATINLPVPVPWFGGTSFIMLYNETNWLGWYILCSLVFSLVFSSLMGIYKKSREVK